MAKKRRDYLEEDDDIEDDELDIEEEEEEEEEKKIKRPSPDRKPLKRVVEADEIDENEDDDDDDEDDEDDDEEVERFAPKKKASRPAKRRDDDDDEDDEDDEVDEDDEDDDDDDEEDDEDDDDEPVVRKKSSRRVREEDDDDEDDEDDDEPVARRKPSRRVREEEDEEPPVMRNVPVPIQRAPSRQAAPSILRTPAENKARAAIRKEKASRVSMVKHILLSFFTFGIWNLIWIAKTTKYLNGTKGFAKRSQGGAVALSMFVPFYASFWYYQSAQRVDKMAREKGVNSNLSVLTLFSGFALPVISFFLTIAVFVLYFVFLQVGEDSFSSLFSLDMLVLTGGLFLFSSAIMTASSFAIQDRLNTVIDRNIEKLSETVSAANRANAQSESQTVDKASLMQEAAAAAKGDAATRTEALLKYKEMYERGQITQTEYNEIRRKFMLA